MIARISKPSKTATQSASSRARPWLLEFMAETAREVEPLMGWTSSSDTRAQIKLWFASEAEAVAYCTRNGLGFRVEQEKEPARRTQLYSDNFKSTRLGQWTH